MGDASRDAPPVPAGGEPGADGEFEFLGADQGADGGAGDGAGGAGGLQTLAPATEEQVASARGALAQEAANETQPGGPATDEAMEDAPVPEDVDPAHTLAEDAAAQDGAQEQRSANDRRRRGAAAQREKGPAVAPSPQAAQPPQQDIDADADAQAAAAAAAAAALERALQPAEVQGGGTALVTLHLARARLGDDEDEQAMLLQDDAMPPLTEQQTAALRAEAEEALAAWRGAAASGAADAELAARAASLWARFEALTAPLASELCEQLRLILEPTLAARLQGDYRTGKRLNMRKIIPYLASEFRRDKIWLRRSKPSTRKYQARAPPPARTLCSQLCSARCGPGGSR